MEGGQQAMSTISMPNVVGRLGKITFPTGFMSDATRGSCERAISFADEGSRKEPLSDKRRS